MMKLKHEEQIEKHKKHEDDVNKMKLRQSQELQKLNLETVKELIERDKLKETLYQVRF